MAGPLFGVARGVTVVTCSHCGKRQARARTLVARPITCKACGKKFTPGAAKPAATKKR